MMKKTILQLLTILFLLVFGGSFQAFAQSIGGKILSLKNEPVPYANIFIKELQTGTTSDDEGVFFMNLEVQGEYEVIVSSIGYETQSIKIVVTDAPYPLYVRLKASAIDIEEIVVRASKRDSAYAIIQEVIDRKKSYLANIQSFKSEVYVKATEIIDRQPKPSDAKKEVEDLDKLESDGEGIIIDDGQSALEKANQNLLSSLNMVEIKLTLHHAFPKKYKEERTAFKSSGSRAGLFIPLFGESDFNFYRNIVSLNGIADAPLISPISSTSILSYKYKLMETRNENGQVVYKIKVIPRKTGNSTCSGYIYINDSIWNINRLELELHKGGLKLFDAFEIKLKYEQINDTLWIPARQEFVYETKQGRFKTFKGNTVLVYSDYQNNYAYDAKFFTNEVVVTTKEAYKRDSTYWNTARLEPLTADENKVIQLRDSISAILDSKEYKDSVTAAYNKITLFEVLWDGVGWRNHEKKSSLYVGSLPSMINYSVVGGWRVSPYVFRSKRWENGQRMNVWTNVSYGLKNEDIQGRFGGWYRYNPHKLADVRLNFGRTFQSINNFDAYLNQLRVSNYILNDGIEASHRFELFNGLYLKTGASFNNRQPLDNYETSSGLSNWIAGITDTEDEPMQFDGYQAFISEISLSYTPAQKFMTEPNNKLILGSKYPTFTLLHRKGWKGTLGSDIDFDYLEFSVNQEVIMGAFGTSKYTAQVGSFVNTKELKFIDLKRFRQSDPFLYSTPLYSFQALDTSLNTSDLFFEFHHIHHFNGALINNIPLLKKTNIRMVAGGGFMWVKQNNYRHEELFLGFERVFKLGPRRRMRIGLYGVAANGNAAVADMSYKVSFDIIDTWKKDWSF